MANITISNLNPTDSDIFSNSESYMMDLSENEIDATNGGWFGAAVSVAGLIVGVAGLF